MVVCRLVLFGLWLLLGKFIWFGCLLRWLVCLVNRMCGCLLWNMMGVMMVVCWFVLMVIGLC